MRSQNKHFGNISINIAETFHKGLEKNNKDLREISEGKLINTLNIIFEYLDNKFKIVNFPTLKIVKF